MSTTPFRRLVIATLWVVVAITLWDAARDSWSGGNWSRLLTGDRLPSLAYMFALLFVMLVLRGLRWALQLGGRLSAARLTIIAAYGWCFAISVLWPFRVGDLARIWWARLRGGKVGMTVGTVLVERTVDLLTLLIGAAAVATAYLADDAMRGIAIILAGLAVVAYGTLFSLGPLLSGAVRRLHRSLAGRDRAAWLVGLVRAPAEELSEILVEMRGPWLQLGLVLLTLLSWACQVAAYHVFLSGFLPGLPWAASLTVLIAVNFAAVLPLAPGNLGLYHVAAIYALGFFGISSGVALVVVTALHATVLTSFLLIGVVGRLVLAAHGQPLRELI